MRSMMRWVIAWAGVADTGAVLDETPGTGTADGRTGGVIVSDAPNPGKKSSVWETNDEKLLLACSSR